MPLTTIADECVKHIVFRNLDSKFQFNLIHVATVSTKLAKLAAATSAVSFLRKQRIAKLTGLLTNLQTKLQSYLHDPNQLVLSAEQAFQARHQLS